MNQELYMDLSIIIVNWNTGKLLVECVRSIHKFTTGRSFEIIVVDNASSDDSVQMLEKEFPEINLTKNTENVGFAKANNQAYSQAKGKYINEISLDTYLLHLYYRELVLPKEKYMILRRACCF